MFVENTGVVSPTHICVWNFGFEFFFNFLTEMYPIRADRLKKVIGSEAVFWPERHTGKSVVCMHWVEMYVRVLVPMPGLRKHFNWSNELRDTGIACAPHLLFCLPPLLQSARLTINKLWSKIFIHINFIFSYGEAKFLWPRAADSSATLSSNLKISQKHSTQWTSTLPFKHVQKVKKKSPSPSEYGNQLHLIHLTEHHLVFL